MDLDANQCPQCDATLASPRRTFAVLPLAVVLVAAGAVTVWLLQDRPAAEPGRRVAEDTTGVAESDQVRRQTGAHVAIPGQPPPAADRSPVSATPFVRAYAARSRQPVQLVALDHSGPPDRMHYCVPARRLPSREALVTAEGIPFTAITWERRSDLVLLVGPRAQPLPPGLEPLATRDPRSLHRDDPLAVITQLGRTAQEVRRTGFGERLQFDQGVPADSVLVDGDGLGVAWYCDGEGLPLHALAAWKDWWNGRPLAEMQAQIRAADPATVLADARDLLQGADAGAETPGGRAGLAGIVRALELLERGQHLARDAASIAEFDRLIRFGHRQRVRLLAAHSGVQALRQARASLDLLGADPDLLSDAVELALEHAEPTDALALYQSLLATSADHARKIAGHLGTRLRHRIEAMLAEQRVQEAARVLADAILSLPQRADLRMLYARAAGRLGDRVTARVQAEAAARLDPAFAAQAARYRDDPGSRRPGRTVEVEYDPAQSSIQLTGAVGSVPIRFVVDTGATYTTIPTSAARALNLISDKNPVVEVATAGGMVKAQQVELPSLTIADRITVRKVRALILDLPGTTQGHGLLGLNVLGQLNLQIDSRRGRLRLWKRGRQR